MSRNGRTPGGGSSESSTSTLAPSTISCEHSAHGLPFSLPVNVCNTHGRWQAHPNAPIAALSLVPYHPSPIPSTKLRAIPRGAPAKHVHFVERPICTLNPLGTLPLRSTQDVPQTLHIGMPELINPGACTQLFTALDRTNQDRIA
jgi:hypothetical protein